ncbi:MAG: FMN-binding protein [Desulfatitalea sp.]|nr:FMN-binding protein [Desulfatitalea sp.]
MPNAFKSILFAAILCVVCSVLLTAASTGLQSFQQKNAEVDRQKNVLIAFGAIKEGASYASDRIQQLYRERVRSAWVDEDGRVVQEERRSATHLPIYLYMADEVIQAYVVPIDSRGLWGRIHGYMAIENDGVTIRGFTVYKHQETPGLGGEIESRWFRKNFEGKRIVAQDNHFVSAKIAKGQVGNQVPPDQRANYVDGISGATMTGKFLSEGMKETLKAYEPVAIRFRHENPSYIRVK